MKKLLHLLIGLTASVAIAKTDCTAYFTVKTADCSMPNPTLVHFLDQSVTVPEGHITYTWNFGDGSSSHDRFPSHNYSQPGTYYACLHIREDINGQIYEADYCQDVTVQRCCDIEADFDLCVNPKNNKVHFTNLTTGADYYYWTFGDGGVSSDVNPVHQFTAAGTYQVCLIAYDSNCTDTAVFNLTICGGTQEPCRREGYIIPIQNGGWFDDSLSLPQYPQIAGTCLGAYYNGVQLQNVTWSVNGQTFVANEYCYDLVLPGTYQVCFEAVWENCTVKACTTLVFGNPCTPDYNGRIEHYTGYDSITILPYPLPPINTGNCFNAFSSTGEYIYNATFKLDGQYQNSNCFQLHAGYNEVCFSGLNSQGCEVFGCDTVYVQDSTENPCPTDFPISVQMLSQYYYYVTTTASKIFIDGQVVTTPNGATYYQFGPGVHTICYQRYQEPSNCDGCYTFTVGQDSSNYPNDSIFHVSAFPNPVQGGLTNVLISSPDIRDIELVVTNQMGQIFVRRSHTLHIGENVLPIDLTNHADGMYHIGVIDSRNSHISDVKIIK